MTPPFAERLLQLAQGGELTIPSRCEIHVGELDWQCQPDKIQNFAKLTGMPVKIVPEGGHLLSHSYVGELLGRWLR